MYTKGKWKVTDINESIYVEENGDWTTICYGIENPANAQLISATPNLLEACMDASNYLQFNEGNAKPIYNKLQQAINKAEGK